MRKIEFNIPTEVIKEFVEAMTDRNLTNSISGTTEEGEVIIEVEYDKSESDEIDQLEEIFDKLCSEIEEEEDEN